MKLPLTNISLHRSQVAITSLPVLPGLHRFSADGLILQTTPVGFWPAGVEQRAQYAGVWEKQGWRRPSSLPADRRWPRRLLTFVQFPHAVPSSFALNVEKSSEGEIPSTGHLSGAAGASGWKVECSEDPVIQKRTQDCFHYCHDTGTLQLHFGPRNLRLQFGFRSDKRCNLWQWVNAERLWSGPVAEAWQIGGLIYAGKEDRPLSTAEAARYFDTEFVNEQTIMVKLFVILYSNGCADIHAHFINNELYGNAGFVTGKPCIVLESTGGIGAADGEGGEWELHSQDLERFGGNNPAVYSRNGNRLEWIPFPDTFQVRGVQQNNYTNEKERTYVPDSEKGFEAGLARTAVFQLCCENAMPPVRFLTSPKAYLLAGELSLPMELSPADAALPEGFEDLPELSRTGARVFLRNEMKEGFCSGGTFHFLDEYPDGRWQFASSGNDTADFFLGSYIYQSRELYGLATRSADYGADLRCHHGSFYWRCHGDRGTDKSYSLIYMRFGGLVHAYLESGDPYYMECAAAVANRWIATHRTNWPRRGIGRDAEPVQGILLLYDFTGQEHYFEAARQIARNVVTSLYPDGMWRCGAGAGSWWGVNALEGTPWNGSHLLAGLAEFLMRCDANDPMRAELLEGARRMLIMMLRMLEEMENFHRAAASYVWRRHYYLARAIGDPVIMAGFERVLQTVLRHFRDEGEKYFFQGHHCAGYIDNPWFFIGWKPQ